MGGISSSLGFVSIRAPSTKSHGHSPAEDADLTFAKVVSKGPDGNAVGGFRTRLTSRNMCGVGWGIVEKQARTRADNFSRQRCKNVHCYHMCMCGIHAQCIIWSDVSIIDMYAKHTHTHIYIYIYTVAIDAYTFMH